MRGLRFGFPEGTDQGRNSHGNSSTGEVDLPYSIFRAKFASSCRRDVSLGRKCDIQYGHFLADAMYIRPVLYIAPQDSWYYTHASEMTRG